MKQFSFGYLSLAVALIAIAPVSAVAEGPFSAEAQAKIALCSNPDDVIGFATLSELTSEEGVREVDVYLQVEGLNEDPNKRGVHIHETADCVPCSAAGGHFDPGPASKPSPDGNHPHHAGDLINVELQDGAGVMTTTSSRVTLSPGVLSLFDADGAAFIVHLGEDTYCPEVGEPGCAGGGRAACGIIEPVTLAETLGLAVSSRSNRSNSRPLNRTTVSGNVYIFVTPENPDTDIAQVDFLIDGEAVKTELAAPYDLQGTRSSSRARALNTNNLSEGQHTVAARIELDSGDVEYRTASFTVIRNGGDDDDDD